MAVQNLQNASPVQSTSAPTAASKSEKAAKATANAAAAYAKSDTPPSVKDAANVQISDKAKAMSLAKKVAEQAPDVDPANEARVAKLKEQIANGNYQANAENIAKGIVREALIDDHVQNG